MILLLSLIRLIMVFTILIITKILIIINNSLRGVGLKFIKNDTSSNMDNLLKYSCLELILTINLIRSSGVWLKLKNPSIIIITVIKLIFIIVALYVYIKLFIIYWNYYY